MTYRTFNILGRADDSAGTVTVDGVVVHNGIFKERVLFEFVTDITLHGKVDVMVSMTYGSIIIDSVNVTYPAVIGGMTGFVRFPILLAQPLQPHRLPLTIDGDIEFSNYMPNGPSAWIIDDSPQRYINIEDMKEAFKSGSIKLDWGYKHEPININKMDELSKRLMQKRSIIPSFITRLHRRLRKSIGL